MIFYNTIVRKLSAGEIKDVMKFPAKDKVK